MFKFFDAILSFVETIVSFVWNMFQLLIYRGREHYPCGCLAVPLHRIPAAMADRYANCFSIARRVTKFLTVSHASNNVTSIRRLIICISIASRFKSRLRALFRCIFRKSWPSPITSIFRLMSFSRIRRFFVTSSWILSIFCVT